MMSRDATITIRLPAELKAELEALAAADDRSLSAYIVRRLTVVSKVGKAIAETAPAKPKR